MSGARAVLGAVVVSALVAGSSFAALPASELHDAVQEGNGARVVALLQSRPELVNERSARYDRCTPLHLAVRRRNTDLVLLLVERGADVNAINQYGLSPLDLARGYGLEAIGTFLEFNGGRAVHQEGGNAKEPARPEPAAPAPAGASDPDEAGEPAATRTAEPPASARPASEANAKLPIPAGRTFVASPFPFGAPPTPVATEPEATPPPAPEEPPATNPAATSDAREDSLSTAPSDTGEPTTKTAPLAEAPVRWPTFFQPFPPGRNLLTLKNDKQTGATVGLRRGNAGIDLIVAGRGSRTLRLPDGEYRVYLLFRDEPGTVYRGDDLKLGGGSYELGIQSALHNSSPKSSRN